MKYALIGKKLGHSFSKDIHNFAGLDYDLVELAECEVADFLKKADYDGFNVTIPYKETVYRLVDELDDTAKFIGSVNTVKYENGKSRGYNTDISGMRYMLERINCGVKDRTVLILGSGGTSKTAQALCSTDGAKKYYVCSRNGEINYENVFEKARDAEIIINCTPVGMYPNCEQKPIDVTRFADLICVADCIYNPLKSEMLLDAEGCGASFTGGLPMLAAQAVYAEEIWSGRAVNPAFIEKIISVLLKKKTNIVLVGMPGSGKSTVGRKLAEILHRELLDTDEVIATGFDSPSKIISERGEAEFRKIEEAAVARVSSDGGVIVATGGGVILSEKNQRALRRNGLVVYIERNIDELSTENRPLSHSIGLKKLFEIREPLYKKTADFIVNNDGSIENTVKEIVDFYENIGN